MSGALGETAASLLLWRHRYRLLIPAPRASDSSSAANNVGPGLGPNATAGVAATAAASQTHYLPSLALGGLARALSAAAAAAPTPAPGCAWLLSNALGTDAESNNSVASARSKPRAVLYISAAAALLPHLSAVAAVVAAFEAHVATLPHDVLAQLGWDVFLPTAAAVTGPNGTNSANAPVMAMGGASDVAATVAGTAATPWHERLLAALAAPAPADVAAATAASVAATPAAAANAAAAAAATAAAAAAASATSPVLLCLAEARVALGWALHRTVGSTVAAADAAAARGAVAAADAAESAARQPRLLGARAQTPVASARARRRGAIALRFTAAMTTALSSTATRGAGTSNVSGPAMAAALLRAAYVAARAVPSLTPRWFQAPAAFLVAAATAAGHGRGADKDRSRAGRGRRGAPTLAAAAGTHAQQRHWGPAPAATAGTSASANATAAASAAAAAKGEARWTAEAALVKAMSATLGTDNNAHSATNPGARDVGAGRASQRLAHVVIGMHTRNFPAFVAHALSTAAASVNANIAINRSNSDGNGNSHEKPNSVVTRSKANASARAQMWGGVVPVLLARALAAERAAVSAAVQRGWVRALVAVNALPASALTDSVFANSNANSGLEAGHYGEADSAFSGSVAPTATSTTTAAPNSGTGASATAGGSAASAKKPARHATAKLANATSTAGLPVAAAPIAELSLAGSAPVPSSAATAAEVGALSALAEAWIGEVDTELLAAARLSAPTGGTEDAAAGQQRALATRRHAQLHAARLALQRAAAAVRTLQGITPSDCGALGATDNALVAVPSKGGALSLRALSEAEGRMLAAGVNTLAMAPGARADAAAAPRPPRQGVALAAATGAAGSGTAPVAAVEPRMLLLDGSAVPAPVSARDAAARMARSAAFGLPVRPLPSATAAAAAAEAAAAARSAAAAAAAAATTGNDGATAVGVAGADLAVLAHTASRGFNVFGNSSSTGSLVHVTAVSAGVANNNNSGDSTMLVQSGTRAGWLSFNEGANKRPLIANNANTSAGSHTASPSAQGNEDALMLLASAFPSLALTAGAPPAAARALAAAGLSLRPYAAPALGPARPFAPARSGLGGGAAAAPGAHGAAHGTGPGVGVVARTWERDDARDWETGALLSLVALGTSAAAPLAGLWHGLAGAADDGAAEGGAIESPRWPPTAAASTGEQHHSPHLSSAPAHVPVSAYLPSSRQDRVVSVAVPPPLPPALAGTGPLSRPGATSTAAVAGARLPRALRRALAPTLVRSAVLPIAGSGHHGSHGMSTAAESTDAASASATGDRLTLPSIFQPSGNAANAPLPLTRGAEASERLRPFTRYYMDPAAVSTVTAQLVAAAKAAKDAGKHVE